MRMFEILSLSCVVCDLLRLRSSICGRVRSVNSIELIICGWESTY